MAARRQPWVAHTWHSSGSCVANIAELGAPPAHTGRRPAGSGPRRNSEPWAPARADRRGEAVPHAAWTWALSAQRVNPSLAAAWVQPFNHPPLTTPALPPVTERWWVPARAECRLHLSPEQVIVVRRPAGRASHEQIEQRACGPEATHSHTRWHACRPRADRVCSTAARTVHRGHAITRY